MVKRNKDVSVSLTSVCDGVKQKTGCGILQAKCGAHNASCRGREARCRRAYGDADLLVFGHSHVPWDTTADSGQRLLNPGSPTDRRRQPHCTYMTATAENGEITDVALHRLPPRRSAVHAH